MKQKFLVAFGPQDRGGCHTTVLQSQCFTKIYYLSDNFLVKSWITYNSAFTDLATAYLKLRFD